MRTCFGILADQDGFASNDGHYWAIPACEVRSVARVIPVDFDHDHRPVGQVTHLELGPGGNLWCVSEVGDRICRPDGLPYYFSMEYEYGAGDGVDLIGVAITGLPARISARRQPIVFHDGTAHQVARRSSDSFERGLLQRASEAHLKRHGGAIRIHDETDQARRRRHDAGRPLPYELETATPWQRVAPQSRRGFQRGDVEWSQPVPRSVIRVS